MNVITAPNRQPGISLTTDDLFLHRGSVFLAGSIEQGKARQWQQEVLERFKDREGITFFNPRREVWEAEWSQSPDNPLLIEQVRWELEHIQKADVVLFYFQEGTLSPISLLELGISLGRSDDAVVVCEPGFWREANVHETCAFFGRGVHTTLEAGIQALHHYI